MKDQKSALDKQLQKLLQEKPDTSALLDKQQRAIDELVNNLEGLLNGDAREREEEIDRIEEDLRDAIRKKRKQNRDDCIRLQGTAHSNLKELLALCENVK
mmetsp:Transcript_9285/g.8742  ORF Transcript_9285/g.8742 Transcript_9285/m.8742 type:complete len:100 (+) Transcript_9285:2192-2491(+)